MSGHLFTGFDIQMKHGPVQTAPQLRKRGESKSDRISLRWKELVWHFHSKRRGALKQCWVNVMVGSYCCVEKVSIFTSASLDKLVKHNVRWAEELRPWRWAGTTSHHITHTLLGDSLSMLFLLISPWSICFIITISDECYPNTNGPARGS